LNEQKPPNAEKTLKSRLVIGGPLSIQPLDFDDSTRDSVTLDDSNLYKFDKKVKGKVNVAGEYPLSPMDWD
jgi:hypothetical protein